MTRKISALVAGVAFAAAAMAQPAATIEDAQAAYGLYDVPRAEALYRAVADSPAASERDRAIARRELARIDWLVDGDRAGALRLLGDSLPADPDPCPAALLMARILNDGREAGPFPPALASLASTCAEAEPALSLQMVQALHRQAKAAPPAARPALAVRALDGWLALPEAARTSLAGTRLRLTLGLIGADRGQALAGWRSYFWLGENEPQTALGVSAAEVDRIFERGLAPGASGADSLALARLLLRAGFYDEFRHYAADRGLERLARRDPAAWRPFAVYIRLREGLLREISTHDRAFARAGAADEDAYEARLGALLAEAATALGGDGADPIPALYRAYGIWGTLPGKSNGVSGVHLGHVVLDERRSVEQDGRQGAIRFIVIDNMVHNGFSAWLMDGLSAPGGWAADGATIVQIRPRYLQTIDTFAGLAVEGPARSRALAERDGQRSRDRTIAAAAPISFLPGVRDRLRLQAGDAIAADVRARLRPGEDFARAFRQAYWGAMVASSIVAHEGRHILDQVQFPGESALPNEELEYRGKLSEIRFAPYPRLALASIYGPLLGGSSGHGIANRRLMQAFAMWITAHAREIAGYDRALSALEQLDRLSDDQIRAVAASLDPAARLP